MGTAGWAFDLAGNLTLEELKWLGQEPGLEVATFEAKSAPLRQIVSLCEA